MGFNVDRSCRGGAGTGRVFSKGISDSRLSNELSGLSICLYVYMRARVCASTRTHVRSVHELWGKKKGEGKWESQREREKGTLIGTSDGTVMPIN